MASSPEPNGAAAPAPVPAAVAVPQATPARSAPHPIPFAPLCAIFVLSGVAGLVYEVVWTRKLLLVFGSTSFAVGTVLASFMGGLAAGSHLFGRRADRSRDCLLLYAALEIGVAVYGLASPWLIDGLQEVYLALHRALAPDFALSVALRFVLASAFIVAPTLLMGGTLPVLARATVRGGARASTVGALYSVNTAGAVVGVLLCGLWFLPLIGVKLTLVAAAGLNVAAALLTLALRARTQREGGEVPVPDATDQAAAADVVVPAAAGPETARPLARWVLIAMFLSGLSTFCYEVAWTRTLHMIVGSTHDALTVLLAAFLVGIALGSAAVARLADRTPDATRLFLALEWGIAVLALLVIPLLGELPYALILGQDWIGESNARFVLVQFLLCLAVMIGPTLLIGATFPVAARIFLGGRPDVGSGVGHLVLWNTSGNIAGALLASFALIPMIGALGTSRLGAVLNAAAGIALFAAAGGAKRSPGWAVAAGGSVVALLVLGPAWDREAIAAGAWLYAHQYQGMSRAEVRAALARDKLLYVREGLDSVVVVREGPDGRSLQVNGKTEASTRADQLGAIVLLAQIPLQYHPAPRSVLVIGWGTGVSVGSFSVDPRVEHIDLVELERAVLGATDWFKDANHDAIRNPRIQVHLDDARNFVLRTDRAYDIILSDPPDCWITGPSHLFTVEHLRHAKGRLRPGGIYTQWVATSCIDDDARRSLLRTFHEVFRHVDVWQINQPVEEILVASDEPLVFDVARFRTRFAEPAIRAEFARVGIGDPATLLSRRVGAIPREAWFDADVNSDHLPVLEFTHSANFVRASNLMDPRPWFLSQRGEAYDLPLAGLPDAERPAFLRELGDALEQWGDPIAALRVYGELAGLDPHAPDAPAHRGRLFLDLGRADLALAEAGEAARRDPADPPANYVLGVALARTGRPQEGVEPLRRCVASGQAHPAARLTLGRLLLSLQRADEALPELEAFHAAMPTNPDGLAALAACWERKGDAGRARDFLGRALHAEPRPAERAALLEWQRRLR